MQYTTQSPWSVRQPGSRLGSCQPSPSSFLRYTPPSGKASRTKKAGHLHTPQKKKVSTNKSFGQNQPLYMEPYHVTEPSNICAGQSDFINTLTSDYAIPSGPVVQPDRLGSTTSSSLISLEQSSDWQGLLKKRLG